MKPYELKHSDKMSRRACATCGATQWEVVRVIGSGAGERYPYRCRCCHTVTNVAEPKSPWLIPAAVVDMTAEIACEKCGSISTAGGCEWHHIMPRSVVGDNCDDWPQVLLCRQCHEELHRIMRDFIELRRQTIKRKWDQ